MKATDYIRAIQSDRMTSMHFVRLKWASLMLESEMKVVEQLSTERFEMQETGWTTWVIEDGFAVMIRPRNRVRR